jgi:FkbM family methyltransferase
MSMLSTLLRPIFLATRDRRGHDLLCRTVGRVLRAGGHRQVIRTDWGFQLDAHLEDWIQWLLWSAGTYTVEADAINGFIEDLRDGDVFYDVGANFGLYTLLAAFSGKCPLKIYSWEPQQRMQSKLLTNLSLNCCNNVIPLGLGLGMRGGEHELQLAAPTNTGSTSFVSGVANTVDTIGVQSALVLALDDFCRYLTPPTVMKIDVEGWELCVLRGAAQTLMTHKPRLHIEINPEALLAAGASGNELIGFLTDLGYRGRVEYDGERFYSLACFEAVS